ncbi:MAG: hypothetical protein KAY24_10475 [Candidatus Eisenbacteria sp.]|nr:hypothetical protein [Candidatus Eisenbacteria bacterium]
MRVATPPDPRSGKTELVLDPLDWIHAVTQQILIPSATHNRYYGAYSNRKRKAMGPTWRSIARMAFSLAGGSRHESDRLLIGRPHPDNQCALPGRDPYRGMGVRIVRTE